MKATDIIYKAKSATTGEWVQGNYINSFSPGIIHNKSFQGNWSAINPETLCIGFKDEAGKLWFAGDKVVDLFNKDNGVIHFYIDGFFVSFKYAQNKKLSDCRHHLTVIGNIYD